MDEPGEAALKAELEKMLAGLAELKELCDSLVAENAALRARLALYEKPGTVVPEQPGAAAPGTAPDDFTGEIPGKPGMYRLSQSDLKYVIDRLTFLARNDKCKAVREIVENMVKLRLPEHQMHQIREVFVYECLGHEAWLDLPTPEIKMRKIDD